jgi:hypothetical protein
MFAGEPDTHIEIINSRNDFPKTKDMGESKLADTPSPSPVFNPQSLIGHSFLMDKWADGELPRCTIMQLIEEMSHQLKRTLLELNLGYLSTMAKKKKL